MKLAHASEVVRAKGLRFGVAVAASGGGAGKLECEEEGGTDFRGRSGEVWTLTGVEAAGAVASFEEGAGEGSSRSSEVKPSVAAILDASCRRWGRQAASSPEKQRKRAKRRSSA